MHTCEFRQNRCTESYALRKGVMNSYVCCRHLLTDMGEMWHETSAHIAVEHLSVSLESEETRPCISYV
jgi:hypothetical protein